MFAPQSLRSINAILAPSMSPKTPGLLLTPMTTSKMTALLQTKAGVAAVARLLQSRGGEIVRVRGCYSSLANCPINGWKGGMSFIT